MLPSRYVLVLTNLCNLKCSFCFQERKPKETYLTKDEWIDIIKQFPDYSRVTLTGGEPFIYNNFEDIFHEIASRLDCNIISNGLLLTKEKIDFILQYKNFKTLSISIDTIGNINRDVTPKQWEELKEMLNYFLMRKKEINSECKLDIKTTILNENIPNLFEIYKYCVEVLKTESHSFQVLKGSPLQHSDIEYNYEDIYREYKALQYDNFEELQKQLSSIREYNILNNKLSFTHPKFTSLTTVSDNSYSYINNEFHEKDKFELCKAPWSSVHINYDGKLFPCLSVNMGNLKEKSLQDIIFGEKYILFKNDIKQHHTFPSCNRCGWLKVKNNEK